MLEDDFTYVTRKALLGLGLSPAEAAGAAGLPETDVLAFTRGRFSKEVARNLAPVLGLWPDALASLPEYEPAPVEKDFITQLVLPFGDEHVNAWLLHHQNLSLLFDAGDLAGTCTAALDQSGKSIPDGVFITHNHPDHVADIPRLTLCGVVACGWNIPGTRPIHPGETLECGPLKLHTLDLSGHAVEALGYLVEGLPEQVLVVGDAIFAGSIGGCPTQERYGQALLTLHAALSPLPDSTILLPGHGPATTLGEERQRNPFSI